MGEYATRKSDGQNVKIGTCENMYYLRADQVELIRPESGNVSPLRDWKEIRFRFPWPDEDSVAPGDFEGFDRKMLLTELDVPADLDHENGCKGGRLGASLVQQRVWNGKLVLVMDCGGCSSRYRVPELDEAMPIIERIAQIAEDHRQAEGYESATWWTLVACRALAGYREPNAWTKRTAA